MTATANVVLAETLTAAPVASRALGRLTIAIGALATLISAIGSWIPSLWGDEAASVLSAVRELDSLTTMLAHVDAVHGAYYLALHAWVDLAGTSPFAVRFPSALAAGCCAAGIAWLCGRFGSLRFATLAGMAAAMLPRLTYAGAEARSSAFAAAVATALCILLAEMTLRRTVGRRWWVAYAAVLAGGTYAFFYLGLMIVVAGVVVACAPPLRPQWRRWAVASVAAIALASPVIVFALLERHQVAFLAQRDVVNPDAVLVRMWFGAWPFALLAWGLIVLALAVWATDEVRRIRRGGAWMPRLEAIAVPWLILPMGILLAISPIVAGYSARYGTFAAPAAAVLMAVGVRRLAGLGRSKRMPWLAVLVVTASVIAVAPVWAAQRTPYAKNHSDWNDIATVISEQAAVGDAIVFDEGVRPSRRTRLAMNTNAAAFSALVDPTVRTAAADGVSWHDTAYTVAEAARIGRFDGITRVWVVEYATTRTVDAWGIADLEALGFRRAGATSGYRSTVYLFTR